MVWPERIVSEEQKRFRHESKSVNERPVGGQRQRRCGEGVRGAGGQQVVLFETWELA